MSATIRGVMSPQWLLPLYGVYVIRHITPMRDTWEYAHIPHVVSVHVPVSSHTMHAVHGMVVTIIHVYIHVSIPLGVHVLHVQWYGVCTMSTSWYLPPHGTQYTTSGMSS